MALTLDAPDSPYETRGTAPVVVALDSDEPLPFDTLAVTTPPGNGTISDVDESTGTFTYTADDGFAGGDAVTIEATKGLDTAQTTVSFAVRPPTVLLTGPDVSGPELTNDSTPTFSFVARSGGVDIGGATYRCRVDGGAWTACNSGTFTTVTLSEGAHTFSARAATSSGTNVDSAPPTASFTVDTVAPSGLAILTGPAGTVGPNSATFTFDTATDLHGPITYQCRLVSPADADPAWTTCSGPQSYIGLAEGAHVFEVRAIDDAGNIAGAGRSFTIQTTDPTAPDVDADTEGTDAWTDQPASDADGDALTYSITTPPADGTADGGSSLEYTADAGFSGTDSFEYSVSDGRGGSASGTVTVTVTPQTSITASTASPTALARPSMSFTSPVSGATFECQVTPQADYPGPDWTTCTSPFQPAGGLADGTYVLAVRAVSGALTDPTPDSVTIEVDNSAPSVSDQTFSTEMTAPVSGNLGPASDGDGDALSYDLVAAPADGSLDPQVDLPDFSYTADDGFAGRDTFTVGQDDSRDDGRAEFDVTVEVAPTTTIDDGPANPSADDTPTWTFSSPIAGTGFECRLDSGTWEACDSGTYTAATLASDGIHTLEVRATKDGVEDPTPASSSFTLDTTAPDFTFDAVPDDGDTAAEPTFEFSSSEDPGVTYECRVHPTDTAAGDFSACASGDATPFLSRVTEYTLEVRATDALGNAETHVHAWDQANTTPSADDATASVEGGESVSLDLDATDADGDTLTYGVVGPLQGAVGSLDSGTGDLEYDAAADFAGVDSFTFEADDQREQGVGTGAVDVTVTPQTALGDVPPAETNDTTPTWEFSSPVSGAQFECSLDGGLWEDCDDGTYTPSAPLAEGSHTLEARAVAASLTDPTPVTDTTTVDTTAPGVTIDDAPAALNNSATGEIDFSSADGTATFECRLDGGDWAACEPAVTTPSLTDGEHTFEVRAVDPATNVGLVDSASWETDRTVPDIDLATPPSGQIQGPTEGTSTNVKKPRWWFSRSDLNLVADSVRCRIDTQAWVQGATGCLSPFQAPANLSDGAHTLTVEASDAAGNTRTFTVGFSVDTITPTIGITDAPDARSGPTATFAFASNEPGATFRCRVTGTEAFAYRPCSSPETLSGLLGGLRTFTVKAVDAAGNESTPTSFTWLTVATVPETSISSRPASSTTDRSATFGFTSDDALATYECRLDGGAWAACTSPATRSDLSVGQHTFEVRAINDVGTKDPTPASATWTVTTPPAPPAEPAPPATPPASGTPNTGTIPSGTTPPSTTTTPSTSACTPVRSTALRSKLVSVGGGLKVGVRLSADTIRLGSSVRLTLVTSGAKKALSSVRSVRVVHGTTRAVLQASRWTSTLRPTRTGAGKVTVTIARKSGKALRTTMTLTVLPRCA